MTSAYVFGGLSACALCGSSRLQSNDAVALPARVMTAMLLLLACLLGAANALVVPEEDTVDSSQHQVVWDTVWVGSGRVREASTTFDLPAELVDASRTLVHAKIQKRKVYGKDDRVRIDPASDGSRSPYSAVVKVSTGCSGMLVSERHVLAAAHCVHDGNDYLLSARLFLRAGYLQEDGRAKWTFVKKFFVPAQWRNRTVDNTKHQYSNWADFDFSVLELTDDLGKQRAFVQPGLSGLFCDHAQSVHGAGSEVEFVSFPDDKPRNAMWLTSTQVRTESPQLLYFEGDAWHGASGAALFAWDYNQDTGEQERRVVGILSGNRDTEPEASLQGNFNVAVRLTPLNLIMVCHWIGVEEVCKQRYSDYLDSNKLSSKCNNLHA